MRCKEATGGHPETNRTERRTRAVRVQGAPARHGPGALQNRRKEVKGKGGNGGEVDSLARESVQKGPSPNALA